MDSTKKEKIELLKKIKQLNASLDTSPLEKARRCER